MEVLFLCLSMQEVYWVEVLIDRSFCCRCHRQKDHHLLLLLLRLRHRLQHLC